MRRTALTMLLLAFLLAACAGAGTSPAASQAPPPSGGGGADADDADGIDHPAGDAVVLSVGTEGGFMPVDLVVAQMPHFVLLGDGRVLVPGAQTMEFPGPLLPPLMIRTLTEEGIQEVLRAVADTELFGEDLDLRGAANFVADAGDTVFVVHAGGREVTVRVYGLGTLPPDMRPGDAGLTAAEVEAHRVLGRLNQELMMLDQVLGADSFADEWQPYVPEALRLFVRDASGEVEDELAGPPRDWPGQDDPASVGEAVDGFADGSRCLAVEGEEAAAWLSELQGADQLTRWSDDGERRFAITPRPLLPFEEVACP